MLLEKISFDKIFEAVTQKFVNNFGTKISYQSLRKLNLMFTSYRQKLASFKRFSGIQRNFEIGFRCLVLLEKISFDKIFEAVTQKLAIRCK